MKIHKLVLSSLLVIGFIFSGCIRNGSEEPIAGSTTVTAVDGYIKDANLTDNAGQVGIYTSNGKYTFASSIAYPLRSSGGVLEDTNASFDINMSAQSGLVLSPITAFLENNTTLQTKLAIALSVADSLDSFAIDYVASNNRNLAKLSQLLYLVQKDSALLAAFQTSLTGANPASLSDIFTLAEADVNATMGVNAVTYRTFLSSVLSLNVDPSAYETSIQFEKANLNIESPVFHNNIAYGTVISPFTGKTWLDRNLGAKQICTALNDTACYGNYYQWGRNHDGHQETSSSITTALAGDINNAGSSFITNNNASNNDWASVDVNGALRAVNWSKTDGSSVCPAGFRVPTITELANETTTLSSSTAVYNSFLKLPSAGSRDYSSGVVNSGAGLVWSTTLGQLSGDFYAYHLDFNSNMARTTELNRFAYGYSVRCIQSKNNIALNKTVTPLTNNALGIPSYVTDGSYSTVWWSWESSLSISFVIDLGSTYQIEAISFSPAQTRSYTIESSTDNANWTQRHSGTVTFPVDGIQDITVNPTYTARYLKYTGSNAYNDVAYVGVVEFEVYGTVANP